jgi:hypothetical protein
MVAAWLGFEFVGNGLLQEHRKCFCALGGPSKRACYTMALLWAKDHNCRIFQQKIEPL